MSEIDAWCRLNEVESLEERVRLIKMVRALDDVYIKHVMKRAAARKPKGKKP